MLVLTRKTQQQIHVGNDIVITILQVKGQCVRVGIEAPRQVRVVRGELTQSQGETATEVTADVAPSVQAEATHEAASEIDGVVKTSPGADLDHLLTLTFSGRRSSTSPMNRLRLQDTYARGCEPLKDRRAAKKTSAERPIAGRSALHQLVAARRDA